MESALGKPAARNEALALTELERVRHRDELTALFDAPLSAPDLAREDESLRAGARLGEPALDDQQVGALASLNDGALRHGL